MELKIKKETAKQIYDESSSGLKKILEETFGIDCFKKTDFRDLKTFNDLCKACGTTEQEFEEKWEALELDESTIHFERMKIMYQAINQGWIHDTMDTSQYKWAPWFRVSGSGLDFSDSNCYGGADASVGFPLCFESEEKSDHAGRQFTAMWQQFITGKKQ